MTTIIRFTIYLSIALITALSMGQSYSSKVIDSKTNMPVPFATILTGDNQGVITNEEGVFSINLNRLQRKDSIFISSMGYTSLGISLQDPMPEDIKLIPTTFTLKSVFVDNNPLSPKEIIERVKENLTKNYSVDISKKKIFFRQSDFNNMDKVDFGFKSSTIEELNKPFIDSIARLVPRKSSYYREVVGDFYGDYSRHKFQVDKAAELYDKSKDLSIDGLSDKLERIFKENVKPDSYLKIKSGIFGTKVELDSMANANEEVKEIKTEVEKKPKSRFQQQIKDRISELYEQLFFHEDSKLDILEKSNRYRFTRDDYTFIDGEAVYILRFEPKGKKDFKGVMYVNTNDFAIVRLEFDNVRPLRKFRLLGISMRQNVFRGKMLFGKEASGNYSPRYIELERGSFFGLDRPLKVIEKNKHVKGPRKQNELSLALDIETSSSVKYELVVFDSETISSNTYEAVSENKNVEATYLSKYDPSFWEGYTIMEPNAAIQEFVVLEE